MAMYLTSGMFVNLLYALLCVDINLGCLTGCTECSNDVTCVKCETNYYLEGTVCVPCPYKCANCTSHECEICETGYYGSSCLLSCGLCKEGLCSRNECTHGCKDGYVADITNECTQCQPNCLACTGYCTECKSGFFAYGGFCFSCPVGCTICSSLQTCSSCTSGYDLLEGSCRIQCPDNCEYCLSPNVCSVCSSEYTNSGNSCIPCPDKCFSCLTPTWCTSCSTGYGMSEKSCIRCSDGCLSCLTPTWCTSCTSGYDLSGRACIKQCPVGCQTCSSANICTACYSGYVLSEDSCDIQCPVGCATCSSANVCTACITGYELSRDACIQCPFGCATCSYPNVCTSCTSGYILAGSTCNELPQRHKENDKGGNKNTVYPIIGGAVGGIAVTTLVVVAIYCLRKRKTRNAVRKPESAGTPIATITSLDTERDSVYETLDETDVENSYEPIHPQNVITLVPGTDNSNGDYLTPIRRIPEVTDDHYTTFQHSDRSIL